MARIPGTVDVTEFRATPPSDDGVIVVDADPRSIPIAGPIFGLIEDIAAELMQQYGGCEVEIEP